MSGVIKRFTRAVNMRYREVELIKMGSSSNCLTSHHLSTSLSAVDGVTSVLATHEENNWWETFKLIILKPKLYLSFGSSFIWKFNRKMLIFNHILL